MEPQELQRSDSHARSDPPRIKDVSGGFSLLDLLPSWERSLRARRRSDRTITDYLKATRQLTGWLERQGMPTDPTRITREHVEAFIVAELDRTSPGNAASLYRRLQQCFRWLEEEGEITGSPMSKMRPPALEDKPVDVLPDDHVRKLLAACSGTDFVERRDTAIIRLLIDSGVRRSEIAGIQTGDLDWSSETILVSGKGRGGGRQRVVPFGASTSVALDRYVRARARHRHAGSPWLWLGGKGRLTGSGIYQMLDRRADDAGIPHIHPHQFRHTFSHRWLAAGGGEGDLMRLNGWNSRDMLDRYARSAADARARDAHRKMRLGDDF